MKLLSSILLVFCFFKVSAQSDTIIDIAVDKHLYLNKCLKTKKGNDENFRKTVDINVPFPVKAKVKKIIYSFTTCNKRNTFIKLNTSSQIKTLFKNDSAEFKSTLQKINVPIGSSIVNVYVLNERKVNDFIHNNDSVWNNDYNETSSLVGFKSGLNEITENLNELTSLVLAFSNPSKKNGVEISYSISAICEKEETENGWTRTMKNGIFENLKKDEELFSHLFKGIDLQEKQSIISCSLNIFFQKYSPSALKKKAEFEVQNLIENTILECKKERSKKPEDKKQD